MERNVPSSWVGTVALIPALSPQWAPSGAPGSAGTKMAQKLVQRRSKPQVAANPAARISNGGKTTGGSSGKQSGAKTSNRAGKQRTWSDMFSNMACGAARYAGHPLAFLTAVLLVLIWAFTGPLFNYSDTWQLVINTSTTIVTFLMVFLIQHTQNRDTLAVQLKLAELIMAATGAEDRLATAEDLSEEELEEMHKDYQRRAEDTLDRLKQHRARLKHAS
jgi:low affinity Fe/Cu permease